MPHLDFAPRLARYAALLNSSQWGLYFHGAAAPFEAFDSKLIGMGKDANSALGCFVIDNPNGAVTYADQVRGEQAGAVLVTLVREAKPFGFSSFSEFYGQDWPESDDTDLDRAGFERLREELLAKGHDSAWFELDDDGLIGVALAPAHIVVLGSLSLEDARRLWTDDFFSSWWDAKDSTQKRKALEIIQALTVAA